MALGVALMMAGIAAAAPIVDGYITSNYAAEVRDLVDGYRYTITVSVPTGDPTKIAAFGGNEAQVDPHITIPDEYIVDPDPADLWVNFRSGGSNNYLQWVAPGWPPPFFPATFVDAGETVTASFWCAYAPTTEIPLYWIDDAILVHPVQGYWPADNSAPEVPEPVSLVFFGTGLAGVFAFAARKRMAKA